MMDWQAEYYKAFGAFPFYAEPSDELVVEDENGNYYRVDPITAEDTMKRSLEVGRNLFFDEEKKFDPYPDIAAEY